MTEAHAVDVNKLDSGEFMKSIRTLFTAALFVCLGAGAFAQSLPFSFGLWGDTPYAKPSVQTGKLACHLVKAL